MEITWKSALVGVGAFVSVMVAILIAIGQTIDAESSRNQAAILEARKASQDEIARLREEMRGDRDSVLARMNHGDQVERDRFKAIEDALAAFVANAGDRFAANERHLTILACQIGNVKICPGTERWDRPPGPRPFVSPQDLLR